MKNILLIIMFFEVTSILCENDTDSKWYCIAENDTGFMIADPKGKDSSFLDLKHFTVDNAAKLFNISFERNAKWELLDSIENNSRLISGVFDQRWETFIDNHNNPTILNEKIDGGNSSLFFSVRIFNDTNTPVFSGEKQWHHLHFNENKFYLCKGPALDNCTEPINVTVTNTDFFLNSTERKNVWKLHSYKYFYTEMMKNDTNIYKNTETENCSKITIGCIQIYLASCKNCVITLVVKSGNNSHFQDVNGTGNWKTVKIDLHEVKNMTTCLNLSVTTKTTESQKEFWAIGDIGYLSTSRKCGDNKRYLNVTKSQIDESSLTCEDANNTKIDFISEKAFLNLTKPPPEKIIDKKPTTSPPKESNIYYLLIIIPIALLILMGVLMFLYIRKLKKRKNTLTAEEEELLELKWKNSSKTEMRCNFTPIKTKDFVDFVRNSFGENRTNSDIDKQFKCLPQDVLKPTDVGKLPENVEKNRYPNICPYDENRVKLQESLSDRDGTDYINASYIKGYNSSKEYILTQNPLEHTVQEFFRMIWQEEVEYVVMITNINEKFFCYWPNQYKTKRYGDIEIDMDDMTSYEFYKHHQCTIRRFGQNRKLNHFHFHSWPHDVISSHIFLEFMNHMLEIPHNLAPIVFHCLAGIGRSATIVLCDIALRTSAIKNVVPLYDIALQMRECRPAAVPNLRQYQLAHLIIFDFLTYKSCAIEINNDFEAYFCRLVEGNTTKTIWSRYLENSDWMYEALTPYKVCKKYRKRNRYPDDKLLPVEHSRVVLQYKDPDYIHAMFVNNYKQEKSFIVAQQPLPSTLTDFWLMILQNHVKTIINVHELDARNRSDVCFFPTLENDVIKLSGQISIHFKSVDNHLNFEKFRLQVYSEGRPHSTVSLINIRNWHTIKAVPESSDVIINIWYDICGGKEGKVQNFPLLVCCDDGIVSSSLVVCFFYIAEKMLHEHKCDIVAAVRALRSTHTNFINFEQFVFLHHCVLMFYKNYFDKYCKEKSTL